MWQDRRRSGAPLWPRAHRLAVCQALHTPHPGPTASTLTPRAPAAAWLVRAPGRAAPVSDEPPRLTTSRPCVPERCLHHRAMPARVRAHAQLTALPWPLRVSSLSPVSWGPGSLGGGNPIKHLFNLIKWPFTLLSVHSSHCIFYSQSPCWCMEPAVPGCPGAGMIMGTMMGRRGHRGSCHSAP